MSELTFCGLPGEIRNKIYAHLLIIPSHSTPRILGDPLLYPQILAANKQINQEAKNILYGCNTFLAHPTLLADLPRLRLYYDTINKGSLIALITRYHVRVRLDNDPNFSAKQAEESFNRMEELTIEVFQAQYGSSDHKVLRLFEGVRGVKKARLYGSVTLFPEYAKWLEDAMMAPEGCQVKSIEEMGTSPVRPYELWTHGGR